VESNTEYHAVVQNHGTGLAHPEPMQEALGNDSQVRDRLLADHRRLENLFDQLIAAFEANDREAVSSLWTQFDTQLLAHMSVEERYLIPSLLKADDRGARSILKEHEHIRARLTELGAGVDLHIVRVDSARAFVEELRAHARREDELLYKWADEHVAESARRLLLGALIDATVARVHAHTH
jgi:hemerythrin superfamily protein